MGLDIAVCRTEYIDSFRAGSYSGFGKWREELARMVGITLHEMIGFMGIKPWNDDMPFRELLDHSDCDGELTFSECEALAEDFKKYAAKAKKFAQYHLKDSEGSDEWFLEKYDAWRNAVELVIEDDSEDRKIIFC